MKEKGFITRRREGAKMSCFAAQPPFKALVSANQTVAEWKRPSAGRNRFAPSRLRVMPLFFHR